MTAPRSYLTATVLGLCGAAFILPPAASGQASQAYSGYRQSLIASGWRPNAG
jgi:hypothetical protein